MNFNEDDIRNDVGFVCIGQAAGNIGLLFEEKGYNVLYINTPALVSYPNAFRLISVQNYKDKTVFELKWLETREKTIQKMAKLLVIASSIYTGEEKERNGIYEIKR